MGKGSARDGVTRKCIVSGEVMPTDRMFRFVLDPAGQVTPDLVGVLPGRGAWLVGSRDAVEVAVRKNLFSRAFQASVSVPDDLTARIESVLSTAALSALGFARRVGDLAIGFDQARTMLREGNAGALIGAIDGADDGRAKLKSAARNVGFVDVFDGEALSAAIGRDGVVHIAVKKGPSSVRFLREAGRLERFYGGDAER